jgi:hypothetical protein
MGHNEMLIREALRGRDRGQVAISVSSARRAIPTAGARATTGGRQSLCRRADGQLDSER